MRAATESSFWTRLRAGMRHAFAIGVKETLSDDERAVLDQAAALIVSKHLSVPASMLLETSRPLNFLASQALVFLRPCLEPLMKMQDYQRLTDALEKRISVDYLLAAIEKQQRITG